MHFEIFMKYIIRVHITQSYKVFIIAKYISKDEIFDHKFRYHASYFKQKRVQYREV
jgi:hypothetical protein